MIKKFLLYLWQLPQNLLGLLLIAIYKPEIKLTALSSSGGFVTCRRTRKEDK